MIRNNFIDTVGNLAAGTAQGIYLENGPDDVAILDNAFANLAANRSTAGVLIGDTLATDPSNNVRIEGNTIQNVSSVIRGAYGVIANNVAGTPGLVVRDNVIDNLSGQWAHAIGLEGPTPGAVVEYNAISNIIDVSPTPANDAIAVFFEANPPYATAAVNRNSFVNVAIGIAVHPALSTGLADGTCNWSGAMSAVRRRPGVGRARWGRTLRSIPG